MTRENLQKYGNSYIHTAFVFVTQHVLYHTLDLRAQQINCFVYFNVIVVSEPLNNIIVNTINVATSYFRKAIVTRIQFWDILGVQVSL